jgi:hypothetical protein
MNPYARFYASYNTSVKCGNSASKEEVVFEFTGGRTTSLRQLSEAELNDLIDQLNQKSAIRQAQGTKKYSKDETARNTMRRAIIAQFHCAGRDGVRAAKAWAEKQGATIDHVNIKRRFNEYTQPELISLIKKAEKMRVSDMKTISKQL